MSWLKRIFGRKPIAPAKERKSYAEMLPSLKIKDEWVLETKLLVDKYKATKERYLVVSQATGVPTDVLFAIHYRESSLSFKGVLHNGEKIINTGLRTRLVPKGRGPFTTWEEAAMDAMNIEKNKFPEQWDMVGKLMFCEAYNGLGYKNKGVPSPYVLSRTNEYTCGKYVADGKYDSSFVDKQSGVAALILGINES